MPVQAVRGDIGQVVERIEIATPAIGTKHRCCGELLIAPGEVKRHFNLDWITKVWISWFLKTIRADKNPLLVPFSLQPKNTLYNEATFDFY